jgi:hypothetical protein
VELIERGGEERLRRGGILDAAPAEEGGQMPR